MDVTGYDLSRDWFDFCFENPEKVNPNHSAMYFFIIEHCNRLGWAKKFGLPMEMTKNAIGIKNYRTFSKTFNDLVQWGFVEVLERSKNQYSANIIAIVKNTKAHTKALSKAMQKHSQKQVHGIVGINKPITYNQEHINNSSQNNFPEKPKPEDCGDLPEQTVKDCVEAYQIKNYKTITADQVRAYWPIWLRNTYNGTKWAPNIESVRTHFYNTIKNEKFEDIKNAGPATGLSERDRKTIEKMKG